MLVPYKDLKRGKEDPSSNTPFGSYVYTIILIIGGKEFKTTFNCEKERDQWCNRLRDLTIAGRIEDF